MLSVFLQEFSWKEFLMGQEEWPFILEIVLRTVIMFITIIIGLRILGKRGVKQLSIFELVVIIGLGSAAGDPMFYKEVGIISSIIVFAVIIFLYTVVTYLIAKNKKIEEMIEGKCICLIDEGEFSIENFKKENLGSDEFFAELRLNGVSHLGQVEKAIEESSGEISVFFYEDEKVRYGLPTMPGSLDYPLQEIKEKGYYSCTFCGHTEQKHPGNAGSCKKCGKKNWVPSSNKRRVT
ncbi:YetF domain-containing protein [uncultured Chryseobacterium sp.]|uniref:YetF domain-containing protein n=1 Tax=uncultured Chryseobacterium sp. TaxID=259322 RepID=UPI0025F6933C|nr:YetF domain-containing protein [uncultured Chryseobacterium sp.]